MKLLNYFLSALDQEDLAAISPSLEEVSLTTNQVLFEAGQSVDALYFPGSACISVVTIMADGKAVESSTVGKESCAGLLDGVIKERSRSRVFVQVAGSATRLPAATFRDRLAKSPTLLMLTMRHARANTVQSEQGVACNVTHEAHGRLARWLLMTQDRVGAPTFPLTQEYMAVMTGVQRSTVSVIAGHLKKAGTINYTRGQITIVDRDALVSQACECYTVIREEFTRLRDSTHSSED